jgi:hypothetical protein
MAGIVEVSKSSQYRIRAECPGTGRSRVDLNPQPGQAHPEARESARQLGGALEVRLFGGVLVFVTPDDLAVVDQEGAPERGEYASFEA